MKIYFNLDEIGTAFEKGSVVTLGNFDGIHLAHRSLIGSLLNVSQNLGLPPILVTYYPNPSLVLGKNKNLKYIYTEEKKLEILRSLGLTNVLIIPFTKELSEISAYSFIQEILHGKLHAKHILLGFNHFFGKNREGDYDFLQKYKVEFSYTVDKIEPVYADGEKISSSYLRSLILDGDVEKAKSLLGMPFSIQGMVVHGEKRGRTIGFPTANLSLEPSQMLPGTGVYGGYVLLHSIPKKAMMNIGFRPTFEGVEKSIEVHILDFDGDLYGSSIEFIFLKKIRNEIKFSNFEELKSQLNKDQIFTRNLILPI